MKKNNYTTKYVVSDVKTRKSFTSVKDVKKFQNHVDNTEVANPLKFVLGFILILILFISFLRMSGNIGDGTPLTFAGFLEYLSNLQFGQVDWNLANISIVQDWGIFNPLRELINLMLGGFNFVLTIVSVLINVVVFLFNIAKFIFIGA